MPLTRTRAPVISIIFETCKHDDEQGVGRDRGADAQPLEGKLVGAAPEPTSGRAAGGGEVPSRVVHLRNLPDDVLKYQFEDMLQEYGEVEVSVKVKNKNQALVQMKTIEGPAAPQIRRRTDPPPLASPPLSYPPPFPHRRYHRCIRRFSSPPLGGSLIYASVRSRRNSVPIPTSPNPSRSIACQSPAPLAGYCPKRAYN